MDFFDVRTLIVLSMLSALVMAVSVTLVSRLSPDARGFPDWVPGAWGITAGSMLVMGRGALPDLLSVVAGNTVLVGSYSLVVIGFHRFAGGRGGRGWVAGVSGATAVLMVLFTWLWPSTGTRIVAVSAICAAVSVGAVWALRPLAAAHGPSVRLTQGVFAVGALVFLARTFFVLKHGYSGDFLGQRSWYLLTPFVYAVLFQTWTPAAIGQLAHRRVLVGLEAARAAAEAASRAKSSFLATMSHEIRTPMNGVINLTHLALDEPLPSEARGYVAAAHQSAQSLLALLNDVLDFSRLEAERVEVEHLPFSPREVLARVHGLFGPGAKEKGLAFTLDIDAGVPERLVGDPLRLTQVISNLTGNALKFTQAGSVRLRVGAHTGRLQFSVEDTGLGMDAATTAALFRPFSQADASTTRKYGGTGLGLAISQRLTHLLGGTIEVHSAPGTGSRFWFSVPLVVAQTPAPAVVEPGPLIRLDGLSVLVVEDNATNRLVALRLLERQGAKVTMATNGLEALRLLNDGQRFDAVLMDLQMPELDGLETTRRMRAHADCARTPIIAMTADVLTEPSRCLEAGMSDHLFKPIDPRLLYATLARWTAASG